MPRGRKKSPSDNVLAQSPEMSAEIAPAPAEKADKTENVTDKIPAKRGRKPRTETKKAAAPAADNSVKAETAPEIAENKTEKVPAKRGRKSRADKEKTAAMSSADNSVKVEAVTEKTDKSTDKTTTGKVKKTRSDKGTSKAATKTKVDKGVSKRGKKAESTSAAPAHAENAEKVSAPAEKKKRTSNKKAKSNKSEEFVIQSNGNDYTMSDITEMCKNAYRGGTRKQIKSIKVYVKSENNGIRAYYVINDNANGYIDL